MMNKQDLSIVQFARCCDSVQQKKWCESNSNIPDNQREHMKRSFEDQIIRATLSVCPYHLLYLSRRD
jgi:hypothetical protein